MKSSVLSLFVFISKTGTRARAALPQLRGDLDSLNYYFPHIFQDLKDDPSRMSLAETLDFPSFILPVPSPGGQETTSFAIRSESGALFLIDCGNDSVLETLSAWKGDFQRQGIYSELEGCWVTHYHDDHLDALHHLAASMPVPIYADEQPGRDHLES